MDQNKSLLVKLKVHLRPTFAVWFFWLLHSYFVCVCVLKVAILESCDNLYGCFTSFQTENNIYVHDLLTFQQITTVSKAKGASLFTCDLQVSVGEMKFDFVLY